MSCPASPLRVLALVVAVGLSGCATPSRPASPAVAAASAPKAAPRPLDEARLDEARMFKDEHRYGEAAVIYEEQLGLQPDNTLLMANLAHMLSAQARGELDPAQARSLNKRARELAECVEQRGAGDVMTGLILRDVRPDGSVAEPAQSGFSRREEVDRLLRAGEAAFGRNQFVLARECYQKAFALEPANYLAALWAGDVCFAERQFAPAAEWFRRAIAIEPEKETAHRYLGDALARLGRRDEALTEHITALLCEPNLRVTRQHFTEELRASAAAHGRVIPRFPAPAAVDPATNTITLGPGYDTVLAVYSVVCAGWRSRDFGKRYPAEKTLRRSLAEEVAGLEFLIEWAAATEAKEPDNADFRKWQPSIDGLRILHRDGLLEAYALFERVDADLAQDYAAYRTAHRDKLERYIRVYWCGFE